MVSLKNTAFGFVSAKTLKILMQEADETIE
jgi:hypothetical protein